MKKNGFNYYNLVDGVPYDKNGNVMDDGYYIPDEGWHPNDSIYEEEETIYEMFLRQSIDKEK